VKGAPCRPACLLTSIPDSHHHHLLLLLLALLALLLPLI
jgi:hypothetical protein